MYYRIVIVITYKFIDILVVLRSNNQSIYFHSIIFNCRVFVVRNVTPLKLVQVVNIDHSIVISVVGRYNRQQKI